jgi:hypothetical protein
MARQIRARLNSGRKEIGLGIEEFASNGLRGRLLRLMSICSTDSQAGTKAFEREADQKNASLEGPTLMRMQILR